MPSTNSYETVSFLTPKTVQELEQRWAEWLAALRSGNYQQTKVYLHVMGGNTPLGNGPNGKPIPSGFCCLGVANDLIRQKDDRLHWQAVGESLGSERVQTFNFEETDVGYSAFSFYLWFSRELYDGTDPENETSRCINWNDKQDLTFAEIADRAEKELMPGCIERFKAYLAAQTLLDEAQVPPAEENGSESV